MKIDSCKIYNLKSKKMLMYLLNINDKLWFKHNYVLTKIDPYIDKTIQNGDIKKRLIEVPSVELKAIQARLKNIISKIEVPDYVFSGIKGRSYIDNAKKHIGEKYVYKTDMRAFFPNTSRETVYKFFKETLRTSEDIAEILSNFTTVNLDRIYSKNKDEILQFVADKGIKQRNHLISGSPTSPILSYLVNHNMFDELHSFCTKLDIHMSVYVDDIVFSSENNISAKNRRNILSIIKKHYCYISKSKVKYYGKMQVKKITGVIINKQGMMDVPNRLSRKTIDKFREFTKTNDVKMKESLHGCVIAARQIKNVYPNIKRTLNNKIN